MTAETLPAVPVPPDPGPGPGPEPAAEAAPAPAARRRTPGRLRTFLTTVRAVLTRELRWRMRGRRAFVIATVTVLFLGLVVFGIYQLLYQGAVDDARWRLAGPFDDNGFNAGLPFALDAISGEASARIGQAVYGGVLGVLTALILLIAPALAAGVISSEREKQTMELLVTTPISTLGMVVGKLFASLTYVLLLIVASVPLMALVFAFGGVGPEDVLRAYIVMLALAFGAGAIGMFLSALVGRTQIATVVAYLILFGLVVGTIALHTWMFANSGDPEDRLFRDEDRTAPEVLLWLNPLVTDIDLMCNAVPDIRVFCDYITEVRDLPRDVPDLPRDAFWPRSAAAFVGLGVVLTILSTQLISPSRRWRAGRRLKTPPADPPAEAVPGAVG